VGLIDEINGKNHICPDIIFNNQKLLPISFNAPKFFTPIKFTANPTIPNKIILFTIVGNKSTEGGIKLQANQEPTTTEKINKTVIGPSINTLLMPRVSETPRVNLLEFLTYK